jgi:hypothetical protein
MKKILSILILVFLYSCSSSKKTTSDTTNKLYEVLVSSEYGGGNFKFYEVITEQKEFKMLLGDEEIRKFVKPNDINSANFILVNLGEKSNGGYSVEVVNVVEQTDKIIVTLKEIEPKKGENVTMALTNPYAVIKINSKKPIEIK